MSVLDSIERLGRIMQDPSYMVGKHGRSFICLGNFGGEYMTWRSTEYSDGLYGPYATKEEAESVARQLNEANDTN
jgi:hypothetical protein